MTKKERLQKEDEQLDQELIDVLTKISIVAGRMARNIEKYSKKHHAKPLPIIKDGHIIN